MIGTRADSADGREALDTLCRIYRSPVTAYLRAHGYSPSDAEDMTQAFFEQLLLRRMHAAADPERGRFRAFLLTALKRFLVNQHEREQACKRGGGLRMVALEPEPEPDLADGRTPSPEEAFERDYALTVIARALARLRDEAVHAGKADLFDQVSAFLLEPPDASEYTALAEKLDLRRNTLAVAIHRLRNRLRDMVRFELSETVDGPDGLDAEMAALRKALAVRRAQPRYAYDSTG
ncbi:RNA polymerase sigma factor [Pseudoxanthomonas suwonensis]|uniref:RNA polymerase sigma factor n=1 Tax=Pseudoxanthomonas suwonensis TaxID=314722 RepID=UPI000698033D|nr:sigma-70 family RNA polymerase sigma factor [Pseudoxanthomonas suwonensis]